jgi:glutaredoxin
MTGRFLFFKIKSCSGDNLADVTVYALSTCPYCKRTIKFLQEKGVDFEVIFLDELEGDERQEVIKRVHEISGSYAVPLVIKGDKHVLGYDEKAIQDLLEG